MCRAYNIHNIYIRELAYVRAHWLGMNKLEHIVLSYPSHLLQHLDLTSYPVASTTRIYVSFSCYSYRHLLQHLLSGSFSCFQLSNVAFSISPLRNQYNICFIRRRCSNRRRDHPEGRSLYLDKTPHRVKTKRMPS